MIFQIPNTYINLIYWFQHVTSKHFPFTKTDLWRKVFWHKTNVANDSKKFFCFSSLWLCLLLRHFTQLVFNVFIASLSSNVSLNWCSGWVIVLRFSKQKLNEKTKLSISFEFLSSSSSFYILSMFDIMTGQKILKSE